MNRIAVSAVGSALVLVLSGAALCAGDAATTPVAAVAGASPSSPPTATTATAQATLTDALDALLAGSPAALSVAVHDERTGATLRYAAGRRYQTASVVKVDILATLLWQARGQDRDLTADERSLARRMITASDNAAATALWRDIGGTRR